MTTKKATTKKKATRRPSIKERARAIIADAQGYDEETREAVRHSLEKGDAEDLAETVRMAESGSTILDTTLIDERQAEAANALNALLSMPGLPPWMKEGVRMMLDHARRGHSSGTLADLFALTSGDDFKFEPVRELAELISGVLRHPDTPESVRDGIFGGMSNYNFDDTDPCYIRMVIKSAKDDGKKRGGGQ